MVMEFVSLMIINSLMNNTDVGNAHIAKNDITHNHPVALSKLMIDLTDLILFVSNNSKVSFKSCSKRNCKYSAGYTPQYRKDTGAAHGEDCCQRCCTYLQSQTVRNRSFPPEHTLLQTAKSGPGLHQYSCP